VLPNWSLPAAAVAVVLTYVAWTAAAAFDDGDGSAVTLVTTILFWLSLMALAAALVQRAVAQYRDRDRG
jgi:hypothetical protein